MANRQDQNRSNPSQNRQDGDSRQFQQEDRNRGQQGDSSPNSPRGQQQQFDQQGGQLSGGGESRFTDQIREHQEVVDANGQHVGTVDHVQDDQIKLARSDSGDGQHHYVQLSQVAGIEGDKIRLRERGDNDFGQQAG